MGKGFFAGIDSGSTSTDVVILNKEKEMVAGIIMPTGAGAAHGAERALEERLGAKLVISSKAQLCGALGAALFASEGV